MDIAAVTALTIVGLFSIFQVALALGAPLGHFAWGGKHKILPRKLRISSALGIVIFAVFAVFIASKASVVTLIQNETFLNAGLWLMFAYTVMMVVMNGVSRSKHERYTMTPLTLILAVCFFILATA